MITCCDAFPCSESKRDGVEEDPELASLTAHFAAAASTHTHNGDGRFSHVDDLVTNEAKSGAEQPHGLGLPVTTNGSLLSDKERANINHSEQGPSAGVHDQGAVSPPPRDELVEEKAKQYE